MDDKKMEHLNTGGTPCRNTKKRAWCFTWNNYKEEDVKYLTTELKNHKYLFGEEVGNSGTQHLQGAVYFKCPRSFNSVRKLFKNNHIEPCKNWQASLNYCSKEGQTYTNIEVKKTRKSRLLAKYDTIKWRPWQKSVLDIIDKKANDRTINWYWDTKGNCGKSFLCKYLYLKYDAIIADGKKDNVFNQIKLWLDNHKETEDPKLIILDIPRHSMDYLNYGTLEQIKNGMIYSGKYEGGVCVFDSPHVFVFSNSEPIKNKFSLDRWNIICMDEKKDDREFT